MRGQAITELIFGLCTLLIILLVSFQTVLKYYLHTEAPYFCQRALREQILSQSHPTHFSNCRFVSTQFQESLLKSWTFEDCHITQKQEMFTLTFTTKTPLIPTSTIHCQYPKKNHQENEEPS